MIANTYDGVSQFDTLYSEPSSFVQEVCTCLGLLFARFGPNALPAHMVSAAARAEGRALQVCLMSAMMCPA